MQLYSHVIVCVVFLSSVSCNKVRPATVADSIGHKQYKDMLKKLVDNNEGRLETVRKWYRWNQQGLSDLLRSKTTNELEDASEDDDKIVILVLKRESQKRAHASDKDHSSSKVTKSGSVLDKILRKKSNWRDKANKKAMKKCIKACNNAVKEVCKIFVCKSKYKSQFKKNCKSCCKARFLDKKD